MARQKISAKAVAADIRSGMSREGLMEKYSLSAAGLEHLFAKLIENNVVTTVEIARIGRTSTPAARPDSGKASVDPMASKDEGSSLDPQLAKSVIEEVRAGRHFFDIMTRLRVGREELGDIMELLVRRGELSAEEVEAKTTWKTRQCPHCKSRVLERTAPCPKCGKELIPLTSTSPATSPDGKGGEIADEYNCPWDDYWDNKGNLGLVMAYFNTLTRCIKSPSKFYSELPTDHGYWPPLLFGMVSIALPATFAWFMLRLFSGAVGSDGLSSLIFESGVMSIVIFVVAFIGLFGGSLIFHGALMLLRGAHGSFQTTFRVSSYSCATAWCGVVPLIGSIVGNVWGIYLNSVGIRETHRTSNAKAFGAVLMPFCAAFAVLLMFGITHTLPAAGTHGSSSTRSAVAGTYSGTEFRSDKGRFSIFAPSPLQEKKIAAKTPVGTLDVFAFTLREGGSEYSVIYTDMKSSYFPFVKYLPNFLQADDREKVLDRMRDNWAKRIHGAIAGESKISHDGYPGREIVFNAPERFGHDVVLKVRIFLVGSRLYQVFVAAPREELNTPEVNDFFESFRVFSE
jgi:hypothetical protein